MPRTRHTPRQERLQELLHEGRLAAGLTQVEMAKRLGQPQSFVAKYENGDRRLDVVELLEVCEAAGLDAAAMLRELAARPAA